MSSLKPIATKLLKDENKNSWNNIQQTNVSKSFNENESCLRFNSSSGDS